MKTLDPGLARVLKRLHYLLEVILTCVRRYVAHLLCLCHLGEMIHEHEHEHGRSLRAAPKGY